MKHGRTAAGFTFLEILVSLLIISILSGVVGLSLYHYVRKARVEAARMQIKTFQTALRAYQADHGNLPTAAQGLEALCARPELPPVPADYPEEGYLDSARVPRDPWGNPYVYLVPGRESRAFEVLSYGSDGEEGGDGDAADILGSGL